MHLCLFKFHTGLEKYSHFVDSMWKDIAAAQAACASIDNSEIVRFLDVLENSDGILVSGMGELCMGLLLVMSHCWRNSMLVSINNC